MSAKVLVVEDESEIRELIVLHLEREGLIAHSASSAEEGQLLMSQHHYAVVLLDWMLPGASGLQLAQALRKANDRVSILMITAKADASDIVAGLEAGADDYLTKPFDPAVLIARVRALLRRHSNLTSSRAPAASAPATTTGATTVAPAASVAASLLPGPLKIGGLSLNAETYEVKCEKEPIHLTHSEFKLLHALILNQGRVLTRDSLIEYVQGEGVSVVGRTVDTHVFGLRKKLGSCSDVYRNRSRSRLPRENRRELDAMKFLGRSFPWKIGLRFFLNQFVFSFIAIMIIGFSIRYTAYGLFSGTADVHQALANFDAYLTTLFILVLLGLCVFHAWTMHAFF